jgi:hypothetical protein
LKTLKSPERVVSIPAGQCNNLFVHKIPSIAMVDTSALQEKLSAARSIADICQVLSGEGVVMDQLDVAKGLIAQGALPRFADLGPSAQEQVAKLLLLVEENPAAAEAIGSSDLQQIQAIAGSAGITLDPEVTAVLAKPVDLDDATLEKVVGGIDPLTASLISAGIGAIVTIATLWINKHYEAKAKV